MTDVEICNLALGYLGVNPIHTLLDGTTEANLCTAFYTPVKQALLEERVWTFAKTQYTATPDATAPLFDGVARYAVPATCLRVHRCDNGDGDYRIGWQRLGGFIHTDERVDTLYIYGLASDVADAGLPPMFCFALAARLAMEMCIPLTENATLWGSLLKVAELKVREAAGADGSQGKSEQVRSDSIKQRR